MKALSETDLTYTNFFVLNVAGQETENVKHLYTTTLDAYGCLGVLHLALGEFISYRQYTCKLSICFFWWTGGIVE